jgi:hypothetical protein
MIYVNIAKDFTRFPAGRYKKNGATSGEDFREKFLETALQKGEHITVNFDGTVGYGSSFLEEAFGGVVRKLKLTAEFVLSHLSLESSDASIAEEVKSYINDAAAR